jgi:hypothetical protein
LQPDREAAQDVMATPQASKNPMIRSFAFILVVIISMKNVFVLAPRNGISGQSLIRIGSEAQRNE